MKLTFTKALWVISAYKVLKSKQMLVLRHAFEVILLSTNVILSIGITTTYFIYPNLTQKEPKKKFRHCVGIIHGVVNY